MITCVSHYGELCVIVQQAGFIQYDAIVYPLQGVMACTQIYHQEKCGYGYHGNEYNRILKGNSFQVGKFNGKQVKQRGVCHAYDNIYRPCPHHMAFVRVEQLRINQHARAPYYLDGNKKPVAFVLFLFEKRN